MVVPRFVQQALAGQALSVYGDGCQSRCFCHVQDVVAAIIGLSECPAAAEQVFNIGSEEEVSILDLARRVIEIVDTLQLNRSSSHTGDERISLIPYEEAYDSGFEDLRRRVPNISKIRSYTGWCPTWTLEKILSDIVSYYIGATSTSPETTPL
jgi:nucleoside-diphosphate-sugar epimerase